MYYYSGRNAAETITCKTTAVVEDTNMISLGEMSGGPGWISTIA